MNTKKKCKNKAAQGSQAANKPHLRHEARKIKCKRQRHR